MGKLKTILKKLSLLILLIIIIFNIFNFFTFSYSNPIPFEINIASNKNQPNELAELVYNSSRINRIGFYICLYENDKPVHTENIGYYPLNNAINMYTLNPLNLLNKAYGNNSDTGIIKMSLIEDDCIYLDCYSTSYHSKSMTLSKINLFDDLNFNEYKFQFFNHKTDDINKPFLLAEGSHENGSKLKMFIVFNEE